MAVTPDRPGPYASPSTIIDLIARYRDRGLPSPINAEVLGRAGVSDSLIPRTIQTLQTLELITEEGQPTPTFEGLRRAPQAEYEQRMTEWLNGVYADALSYIDPATADDVAIRDAFRNYNPVGQQARMVSLFTGLYAAAGVIKDKAPAQRAPRTSTPKPRAAMQTRATRATSAVKLSPGWTTVARNAAARGHEIPQLPPALAGMMASLPLAEKGWTQEKRDQFLKLFGSALDFCIPILAPGALEDEANEDSEE